MAGQQISLGDLTKRSSGKQNQKNYVSQHIEILDTAEAVVNQLLGRFVVHIKNYLTAARNFCVGQIAPFYGFAVDGDLFDVNVLLALVFSLDGQCFAILKMNDRGFDRGTAELVLPRSRDDRVEAEGREEIP